MKKLFAQIIKFGFVGGLCFLIDFVISTALFHLLINITSRSAATAVGGFVGFTISVVVNYVLSMKFVFERKEDMSRRKEFVIFVILLLGFAVLLSAITRAFKKPKPKEVIKDTQIQASNQINIESNFKFVYVNISKPSFISLYSFITKSLLFLSSGALPNIFIYIGSLFISY